MVIKKVKIKDGKKIWFIVLLVLLVLYLIGIIGNIIVNKSSDTINATHTIVIILLFFNMSNCVEKK